MNWTKEDTHDLKETLIGVFSILGLGLLIGLFSAILGK